MSFPSAAAWHHRDARVGFETVFFEPHDDGYRIDGCTTGVEDSVPWVVRYAISLDPASLTRRARITNRTPSGAAEVRLETDGAGHWTVDGEPASHLDGCLDVDLESSALTNAFPVRRMRLPVGADADAPAAYVRAVDLAVERLEQRYVRVADFDGRACYDYTAPAFDFAARLVYESDGLVRDYPGIAVRVR
jgi:uncharacterized protein